MGKSQYKSVLLNWSPLWAIGAWFHWDPQRSHVDCASEPLPSSVPKVGIYSLVLTPLVKGCPAGCSCAYVTATQRCQSPEAEMKRCMVLLAWVFSCYSCVKIGAYQWLETEQLNKEQLPSGHATTLPITQASSLCCWISCRICCVRSFDTTRAAPIPQLNVLAISSSERCPSCCNHEKILGILQVWASENRQELFN